MSAGQFIAEGTPLAQTRQSCSGSRTRAWNKRPRAAVCSLYTGVRQQVVVNSTSRDQLTGNSTQCAGFLARFTVQAWLYGFHIASDVGLWQVAYAHEVSRCAAVKVAVEKAFVLCIWISERLNM